MAYELSKATRISEVYVKQSVCKEKDGYIRKYILLPGAMVFIDQFVYALPGWLTNTYGLEKEYQ